MMKEKFLTYYMGLAEEISKLSSANRLKVGAILVKDHRIISNGYNGTVSGTDNECEYKEYHEEGLDILNYPYHDSYGNYRTVTKNIVIHAEQNLIGKLAQSNDSGKGSILFLTHSPCIECSKMIYTSGISEVIYKTDYRDDSGIVFLRNSGINIRKL